MTTRKPFAVLTDRGKVVKAAALDAFALTQAESRQLPDQSAFSNFGGKGLLEPTYNPLQLLELLRVNTAHYAACRQKAQDTAGMGWRIDKVSPDADEADRARLVKFFDEAPPPARALDDDSRDDVFKASAFDYQALGRGVLEVVRVDHDPKGVPETIVHVPGETIRVHRDGKRFVQHRGGRFAWFKWLGADFDLDFDSGSMHPLGFLRPERRATEIVWWRNEHPDDKVYGAPDVLPAVGAIVGDLGRRDYNLDFFSNFGVPAYMVSITGDFDPGDTVDANGDPDPSGKTSIEWQIERHFEQLRANPHSTLTLVVPTTGENAGERVEVKFDPVSVDVKEASFRLYRKDNREEVLSAHRMSAAMAGVFDAGAANREALALYKRSVVTPAQAELENIINRFIIRGAFGITGWRWRLVSLDTRDIEKELDAWIKMLGAGIVTPRQFILHFKDVFGLPDPDDDPRLDVRRIAQDRPADMGSDQFAMLRAAVESIAEKQLS